MRAHGGTIEFKDGAAKYSLMADTMKENLSEVKRMDRERTISLILIKYGAGHGKMTNL